jgi:hypothetical protein
MNCGSSETSIYQNYIPNQIDASRPHRRITVDLGKTAHRGRIAERSVLERQQSATLLTIPDSRRIRSSDNKKPILFGLGTLLPQAIKPSA